jgi:hypothetical protein
LFCAQLILVDRLLSSLRDGEDEMIEALMCEFTVTTIVETLEKLGFYENIPSFVDALMGLSVIL